MLNARELGTFRKQLLGWFRQFQRDLPWRRTKDPYRIWLSEIMLQQTRVAAAIPYYERFLQRFPDVHALAAAPQEAVLCLWSGLGYYSRARNLHRGARTIVEKFRGELPDSAAQIREIPGIGEYTAGAVLSIAYGKPEALVDGNVARVLSRMFLLKGDWRSGAAKAELWRVARALMAAACAAQLHPGDFNQALMEWGAAICTPRAPQCGRCPAAQHCLARARGLQRDYPEIKPRTLSPIWKLRSWMVRAANGKVLLAQRENSGLFGGLWELPTEKRPGKNASSSAPKPFLKLKHVLSHRVLQIQAVAITRSEWQARVPRNSEFECWAGRYERFAWISPENLGQGKVALSSVQAQIVKAGRAIFDLKRSGFKPNIGI
jgi:A/G-specific adenine glycosylase